MNQLHYIYEFKETSERCSMESRLKIITKFAEKIIGNFDQLLGPKKKKLTLTYIVKKAYKTEFERLWELEFQMLLSFIEL